MSGFIRVPADDAGKRVDTVTLTDELVEVHRQKMVVTGGSGTAEVVVVTNAAPAGTDMGLVVRHAGTATIAGTVNVNGGVAISGTATIAGAVTISGTATVTGTVNVSGGVAISGTATVAGVVGLTAGTAVIGDLNAISRTVQVAIGTPFTLQGISTTVQVAVGTPFTINNISATVNTSSVIRTSGGTAVEDTTNNALRVNVVAGAAGGVSQVDGTPFTAQEASFAPMGGVFDDATPGTLSEGDAGAVRVTTNRAFHVNLRDTTGAELGAASATGVFVRTATVVVAGGVGISGTATVAGVVGLTAGTANIGFINNISATVIVAGNVNISATPSVILAAGTANFGTLNDISRTVQIAVGTPFTLNNISASVVIATGASFDFNTLASADQIQNVALFGIALPASGGASVGGTNANPLWVNVNTHSQTAAVVLAAGTANFGTLNDISRTVQVAVGTPFTIQGISTTVTVAGVIGLTAGTANIGSINGISASVVTAVRSMYTNTANQSASRGPRTIIASTSANVTLVAAPGVGMSVYVTSLAVSNASGSNTRARIGSSASIGTVQMMMAASGGGFVMQFTPPWRLSANEALLGSVKPDASEGIFNIHFFVASADAL